VDTVEELDTRSKPRRGKWVAGVSLIVAAIAGLAVWAMFSPGALAYYKTPSDIVTAGRASFDGSLRLGGRVADGTLQRNGTSVRFTITDGHAAVPVSFRGDVPDTLKDGTDAIASGTIGPDGTMHATAVQAKCSSKFVPKDRPGDLGREGPGGLPPQDKT
jgi:cytochrome c-type biogenesis protein CcmE